MKYYVGYKTGAFAGIEVEADSADEAIDLAEEQFGPKQLCHQEEVEIGTDWEVDFVEAVDN